MIRKIDSILSKNFFAKKYFHTSLLLLIILVACFLRFYNTPNRYGFDPDAIRDAIITTYGASTFQVPLTGPFSSLGPFTFGPWYYYQLILFRILVPLAYAPWIYMSFISLVVIFVFYKIGELLENKTFGLILAGLAAISPAQIAPATGLSNPNLIAVQAVFALWIFIIIVKKTPSNWWAFFLGVSIGIGINNHYQLSTFLLLPVLLLFTGKTKRFAYFLISLIGVLSTFIPIILFDLTHNHLEIIGIIHTMRNGRPNYVPNRWLLYLRDFWPNFWSHTLGIPIVLGAIILLFSVGANIFLIFKKKISKAYLLLLLTFVAIFIILRFYPGERAVYYLLFLHPFIFIFTGAFFYLFINSKLLYLKYAGIIAFIIFLIFIFFTNLSDTHSFESHTTAVSQAKQISAKYPRSKFILYSCKGITDYQVQAIMFILQTMGKLDSNGVKVGIFSSSCPVAIKSKYSSWEKVETTNLLSMSDSTLRKNGWTAITLVSVYDAYAKWYTK